VIVLAVLAGGMLGAPARYLADRVIQARHDSVFPWGTFAVNVAGSAVLGFLLGARAHLGLPSAAFALLGTGFCGGLTTFSTFGYETLRLLEDGAIGEAGLNVLGSLAVAVLVAWLGFRLAVALLVDRRRLIRWPCYPVAPAIRSQRDRPRAGPAAAPAGRPGPGAGLAAAPGRGSPRSVRPTRARRVDCRGSSAYQPGTSPAGRPDCQHSQRGRSR
jgi:fluoride exporter